MTIRNKIKYSLVLALLTLSLGGLIIHSYVHPYEKFNFGWVPFLVGLTGVLVIPALFLSKRTLHLAYILNGFSVIVGLVAMGHFALTRKPIWPDLLILLPKFFIGYTIFHLESFPNLETSPALGWKSLRYPHLGYWVVHLAGFSVVYALGAIFWS